MFYNVLSAAFYSVVKTDYCALFLITGHVFELSFSGAPGVCDILNARGYVENSSSVSCILLFFCSSAAVQISVSACF